MQCQQAQPAAITDRLSCRRAVLITGVAHVITRRYYLDGLPHGRWFKTAPSGTMPSPHRWRVVREKLWRCSCQCGRPRCHVAFCVWGQSVPSLSSGSNEHPPIRFPSRPRLSQSGLKPCGCGGEAAAGRAVPHKVSLSSVPAWALLESVRLAGDCSQCMSPRAYFLLLFR